MNNSLYVAPEAASLMSLHNRVYTSEKIFMYTKDVHVNDKQVSSQVQFFIRRAVLTKSLNSIRVS